MNLATPRHQRTIAIVQARMGSSRLPGKVLLDVSGIPMLARVVERARLASRLEDVVVATTTDRSDDPVAAFCIERNYPFFRGSLHDVLDRYYGAAREFSAKAIVRLTGDCPLVDPEVIDQTIQGFEQGLDGSIRPTELTGLAGPFDFSCNRLPPPWKRTYPMGLDVEVCSFSALERAWKEADQPYHREHVMPYLYEEVRSEHYILTLGTDPTREPRRLETASATASNPFHVLILDHSPDYGGLRWTVDTPEDLRYVSQILDRFDGKQDFRWLEVIELLAREADLASNNPMTRPKDYREYDQRSMK